MHNMLYILWKYSKQALLKTPEVQNCCRDCGVYILVESKLPAFLGAIGSGAATLATYF